MKNTIKISRLMDAYTDNEFFIQGESEVNMDTVKNNVIQKAAKKKMKPIAKAVIGAAAAAVLAGGTAAVTIPIVMSGSQNTAAGTTYNYSIRDDGYSISINSGDYADIMTEEDGRLYFNLKGETTDITDLVDRETPYIYAYSNTETGDKNYIVMGGTPEQYAIIDLTYIDGGIGWKGDGCMNGIGGNMADLQDLGNDEWHIIAFDISQNFVKNGDGVHIVSGTEEEFHHKHSVMWAGDTISSNDIPENWEDECMDAWLIKALIQLEIIPAF